MTSEARTCTVDTGACHCGEGREWHDHVPEHAYAGFCGLPLVDDKTSPCASVITGELPNGQRGQWTCRVKQGSWIHVSHHAYFASAKCCPIHGAAKRTTNIQHVMGGLS